MAAGLHLLVLIFMVSLRPHHTDAWRAAEYFELAQGMEAQGQFDEAGIALNKIFTQFSRSPSAPAALYALAHHDLMHRGVPEEGTARLRSVIERYPDQPEARGAQKDLDFIALHGSVDSRPVQLFYQSLGQIKRKNMNKAMDNLGMVIWQYQGLPIEPEALYYAARASAGTDQASRYSNWLSEKHPGFIPYYPEIPK